MITIISLFSKVYDIQGELLKVFKKFNWLKNHKNVANSMYGYGYGHGYGYADARLFVPGPVSSRRYWYSEQWHFDVSPL